MWIDEVRSADRLHLAAAIKYANFDTAESGGTVAASQPVLHEIKEWLVEQLRKQLWKYIFIYCICLEIIR